MDNARLEAVISASEEEAGASKAGITLIHSWLDDGRSTCMATRRDDDSAETSLQQFVEALVAAGVLMMMSRSIYRLDAYHFKSACFSWFQS